VLLDGYIPDSSRFFSSFELVRGDVAYRQVVLYWVKESYNETFGFDE